MHVKAARKVPDTKAHNIYFDLLSLKESDRKNISGKIKSVSLTSRSNQADGLFSEYIKPITWIRKKEMARIKREVLIATLPDLIHSPDNNHESVNKPIEITVSMRENGINRATSMALKKKTCLIILEYIRQMFQSVSGK